MVSQPDWRKKIETGHASLDHYLSLDKPGYALLVTGAWGAGKTHFIKHKLPKERLWYVSLFGLDSNAEIHASVMAAIDPKLTKFGSVVSEVGKAGAAAGGLIAGASSIAATLAKSAFRQQIVPADGVLVFDDLERSNIDFRTLLGAINQYVEHLGLSVLIVGHEGKFTADLVAAKAKVIGQSITIHPSSDEAYNSFLSGVPGEATKAYLSENRQVLLPIFRESESEDLRTLRHVIQDAARFFDAIPMSLRKFDEGVATAMKLLTAFNIEVRENRFSETELTRSPETVWAELLAKDDGNSDGYTPNAFEKAQRKYQSVALERTILSDETLRELLLEGSYSSCLIERDLRSDPLFTTDVELPPWLVIWHFDDFEEDEIENAAKRLLAAIEQQSIHDRGTLAHSFAAYLHLAHIKHIDESLEVVRDQAKEYIDDIAARGSLEALNTDETIDGYDDGFFGKAFQTRAETKPLFNDIFQHLNKACRQRFDDEIREKAAFATESLSETSDDFVGLVLGTEELRLPGAYPIFSKFDRSSFFNAWISAPAPIRLSVARAIWSRLNEVSHRPEAAEERLWFRQVLNDLEEHSGTATPIISEQLARLAPRDAIQKLDATISKDRDRAKPANQPSDLSPSAPEG